MLPRSLHQLHDAVKLHGDEEKHEKTDAWCNRDLVPMPPSRRTWGLVEYYGYWSLTSLNVSSWQTPNTYLTAGLSVGQSMGVILICRFVIGFFSTAIAWCGLRWHIGFTIQNRYSWGMRGSYVPLLQRVLLNFIWNAIQCWNGGKLVNVCITAVIPNFANLPDHLPADFPATAPEMVGFFVFWLCSLPFLYLPPERFRRPFQITCVYCAIGMICMLIWSLSVAKGVGPLFYSSQTTTSSSWSVSWIIMSCINSGVGSTAAGMTNGSDFSRYSKSRWGYVLGSNSSIFLTAILVSLVGLIVTSACQQIYGEIYWNPPDLLMRMMDSGQGSSKARAGVFFLALGFALTSGFENICGNAVAGGVDLSGVFPRYINIRRGALITFVAAWICQPWQLINRADRFLSVLSSFSVFLAPIMGIMCCDYYVLRRMRVKLSDLYELHGSYYYTWGFNLRTIPVWIAGWAPTVGGLSYVASGDETGPRALYKIYYCSFFVGFGISFILFYIVNTIFPPGNLGEIDEADYFGTFTLAEARKLGIVPHATGSVVSVTASVEKDKNLVAVGVDEVKSDVFDHAV
ncbi:permease for cytosine/purines, uracil, thiamine, allantoin-domain-containing protein [Armillaria borealis]|uniref:Permease for cytosine/purines, uracil, thiamine, allantoin-domain-containing protein n=1 Tax=Armillaria borealis TaxID=47425 RepID=A0AA39MX02_9AGAR|nr:permease for cytosine/purines, uracil, thiamine, allantoin-domain-containing protein [Armillaria borealis]